MPEMTEEWEESLTPSYHKIFDNKSIAKKTVNGLYEQKATREKRKQKNDVSIREKQQLIPQRDDRQ